jgi:hypothetical protein
MCAVFAALGGAAGPPPAAVETVVNASASPAAPSPAPRERDASENARPRCTMLVVPAPKGLDPEFAKPMMTPVDPGMAAPSPCRP